ncbi:hypothetical protein SERLA73DRAFT_136259 [Serpula lacrymans var. lacrymans S7.3]|uniref:Uncharacterized protein n=1 Tax=Serpula lacrymans var. lacrymans (strain S7.3) TaxID=936435 RepID=F8PU89_SERL3|nr:hypothetical protein SERLA73DRAFT_136259 [Serpula lacrymans var. lacrymans S7.3]
MFWMHVHAKLFLLSKISRWMAHKDISKLFFFYLAENYDNPSALTILPWYEPYLKRHDTNLKDNTGSTAPVL